MTCVSTLCNALILLAIEIAILSGASTRWWQSSQKVNTDANAEDEEMKDFSVRKGYTISCYYELPEMFIPYDAPFLIAR
jgi:hypothetical protein